MGKLDRAVDGGRSSAADRLQRVTSDPVLPSDRVEYTGRPVPGVLEAGAVGWVARVAPGEVVVVWPGGRVHSVPVADLRVLPPEVTRTVGEGSNTSIWGVLGEERPPLQNGRPRDPYMAEGCHPDVVVRVWDELGPELPCDCRAQAKGRPVLAHPETDRIIAAATGTAYALWLTAEDFATAIGAGAKTTQTWAGGSVTDLAERAGSGWIWGRWYEDEPRWLQRAYADSRPVN
jgi:hypothetical protein